MYDLRLTKAEWRSLFNTCASQQKSSTDQQIVNKSFKLLNDKETIQLNTR